jgi:hypothetical protein
MMMTINETNEQLELGFSGYRLRANATRRQDRVARAAWWFAQMRNLVGCAVAETRPEQIWMPGASRQVKI